MYKKKLEDLELELKKQKDNLNFGSMMQMKEPSGEKDERYRIDVTPLEYKIYEEVH